MSDNDNEDMKHHDATQVTVPKWVLQCVFDALTTSMDFGSGFLAEEDVVALRELAVAIGVDPNEGTPANMVCAYRPEGHAWTKAERKYYGQPARTEWWCSTCNKRTTEQPDGWTP